MSVQPRSAMRTFRHCAASAAMAGEAINPESKAKMTVVRILGSPFFLMRRLPANAMASILYVNTESCMSVQISYLLEREMATHGKRTRIEDIRRIELIAAAHRVFLEHGLQGMTSARICREA